MRSLLGVLLSLAIVAALGAGWLYRQWRHAETERTIVEAQLAGAQAQRQDAIEQRAAAERQRLIAERQRQDALQQRSAAERQRLSAEQQRQEALAQRTAAERERLNADQQRQEALEQRTAAERERFNAESQRREAVQQRTVAERLRLLSVGQSLAAQASRAVATGERDLGALLAIQAFRFTIDNGGSPRDPPVFEALRQALFHMELSARALLGHGDEVRALVFVDTSLLVSASDDGTLRSWRLQGAGAHSLIHRGSTRLRALALDGARRRLVTAGSGGHLRRWLVGDDGRVGRPQTIRIDGDVSSVAYTWAGGLVAGLLDGGVRFFRDASASPMAAPALSREEARLQPVLSFGDGPVLVWAAADGGAQLWDASRPSESPRRLGAGLGRVTALAVDGEASRLVVGTLTGEIAVFDLHSMEAPPARLVAHASQVTSLDLRGADRLVSGSLDNTVRLWRLDEPGPAPVTMDHGSWVWSVAYAPDGSQVASAGADRAIRLWPTSSAAMAGTLCGALPRNLDPLEWMEFIGDDIAYQTTCDNLD